MNLLNFEVADDFIAINYDSEYLDLHNNYDFYGIEYITSKRRIILTWFRSNNEWVSKTSPVQIVLEFNGVSLFKSKERDGKIQFSEDECLSSIGFIGNDQIDEIAGFSQSKPAIGFEHLNISFESGFAVKIEAKTVICNTKI